MTLRGFGGNPLFKPVTITNGLEFPIRIKSYCRRSATLRRRLLLRIVKLVFCALDEAFFFLSFADWFVEKA
jgi:hypothetical protein